MTAKQKALARTPLYDLHREAGARLVPFAGYEMPVQFAGIIAEHRHTRAHAGLFDVSHMGQVRLTGAGAADALESLVPADIVELAPGRQRYALFTNDSGGILDDLMVTNAGDHLLLVVNAACKHEDLAHLRRHLGTRCEIDELGEHALLALQGPQAVEALARLAPAVRELSFMQSSAVEVSGAACYVSRSGYTGEDGFELSVPAEHAERLARELLAQPEVAPVGLGARDSLRLEAGLCLYGHDIDTTTTPVEAGLHWAISKTRRRDGARAGGFPGAERILAQTRDNVSRRRVGIRPTGRAPVREGAELIDAEGRRVGIVTSGTFGATVGGPIAMGYVHSTHAHDGTALEAIVRGKPLPVTIAPLPFVQHRYHRGH